MTVVPRSAPLWTAGASTTLALLALGLMRPAEGTIAFFVLLAAAAAGFFGTLWQVAGGVRPSSRALLGCAAMALLCQVPMLLAPPEPGADLPRYVWDAGVVRAGLSPYSVVPQDPAYARLRTAESWPVNNPEVVTPYPPGAQLFFLAATSLSASTRAVKIAALLCEAMLALVVWRALIAIGANPAWVLALLWNPLVALEVARHGHVDVVGALCLACAFLAFVRGRTLPGSIAFALAVAVKPLPIVLLPLSWRRVPLRHVLAAAVVLLGLYLPFLHGRTLPLGSLGDVVDRFRFNGPVFRAAESVAGSAAAAALAIAAGVAVAAWARRRLPLASPQAWAWPMAVALLCAPLVYPWYLVWVAPFLVSVETTPLAVWSVSILGTYVVWRREHPGWAVPPWMLVLEYGALLAAAGWRLRANRPWRRAAVMPPAGAR